MIYDVNRSCNLELVMPSVKNCVISGFVVGGIAFTGYHLYQRYKESEGTKVARFAHPDCNLAAAAVKRAVEKRSPKQNDADISLELQVVLLDTDSKNDKDFILEKIAYSLVNDAIEMAKERITAERNTDEKKSIDNDVLFTSRKLVEHAIESAKEIIITQNLQKEKTVIAFVAKALVDGAIQSAKATVITENIEKEQIVAKALVEDAIQSAKAAVIAEKKQSALRDAARDLVGDAIESAKATIIAENEQQESKKIYHVVKCLVNGAIQYAQNVLKAENAEKLQQCTAIDCAATELVDDVIKSAKKEIKDGGKIQEQKSRSTAASDNQERLLYTARSLVDHVIKSAQEEIFQNNNVTCDGSTDSSSSSLLSSENISDGNLFCIYSSSEETLKSLDKENVNDNKQSETSSSEAIKDVLNSFLCKIQEVANSTFAQKKNEAEILKVKEQLGILWPMIIATWSSSRDKVTENEVSDEKVQSEERTFNSVTGHSTVCEEDASIQACSEEKTSLSEDSDLHDEQVAPEVIKENVGSFLQTIDALSAFLFTQNKSEAEIHQAQEELSMLWPLLVAMRDNLPDNVPVNHD